MPNLPSGTHSHAVIIPIAAMPLRWLRPSLRTSYSSRPPSHTRSWLYIFLVAALVAVANAMPPSRIAELRQEAVDMFYHGFDNYMDIAFPDDELRPVSCAPLTRSSNPRNIDLNDALGNYSLTLIDSLSTLAILASAPPDNKRTGPNALNDFQDGIASLVAQYGDGREGPSGQGLKARGFDLDSKVQVFETVIRGVGGLLSAHLFAIGELPIRNYKPRRASSWLRKTDLPDDQSPIVWSNGFKYDGQLLRLALDLAQRMLPAFYTNTGMPYPRVNLRHGIPFYHRSPLHKGSGPENLAAGTNEVTETCSAGAGSLVLEFTVLSRLTGDPRFEQLAKRAFWAVWSHRSQLGLLGAGIDAEDGKWIGPYAGIGAGTDSFFEYAFKTYILTSGLAPPNTTVPAGKRPDTWLDPNTLYRPLTPEENSSEGFLDAWKEAHDAIKRHLYSGSHHPHYVVAHLATGSPQTYWIDSLGAYYPGLLAIAGELDEAIEAHLLYTALWTRYSALPERWSVRDGTIEGGLGWWPGRPEFIESNYHIFRATKDPWYLHVGEMVLKDIQRRCWAECGWSGLQDVRTGEMSDRMESFFLGETAKYLYLLFDPDHPLNSLDAPYVFTTEGHPLIIPRKSGSQKSTPKVPESYASLENADSCPVPATMLPLTGSSTAARQDIFHAASLVGLHRVPNYNAMDEMALDTTKSLENQWIQPANHSIYPWTLPQSLVPPNGFCTRLPIRDTFWIEFPSSSTLASQGFNIALGSQPVVRVKDEGVLIQNLAGLTVAMIEEENPAQVIYDDEPLPKKSWRILNIGTTPLGRDEKVFISRETIGPIVDPSFTRIRDPLTVDLVIQVENPQVNKTDGKPSSNVPSSAKIEGTHPAEAEAAAESMHLEALADLPSDYRTMFSSLLQQVTSALRDPVATLLPQPSQGSKYQLLSLPAHCAVGTGAAPLPAVAEAPDANTVSNDPLSWTSIYFASHNCDSKLPDRVVREYNVIVMRRGGCSFSEKLANVPAFHPTATGLQMVVMVSDDEEDDLLIRPLLEVVQKTPAGMRRAHEVPMVMVGGGEATWDALKRAKSLGIRRRYWVESARGLRVTNLIVV
ncbi:hypothetical protein V492_01503 [Pseudogymnoascus sp. VKM F-4246]|nr:hypothetical protein V492_01503 [Pseudogymnoascus sp. VKM F-4246]